MPKLSVDEDITFSFGDPNKIPLRCRITGPSPISPNLKAVGKQEEPKININLASPLHLVFAGISLLPLEEENGVRWCHSSSSAVI